MTVGPTSRPVLTRVDHVTAREVLKAPTFAEISPLLLQSVIVTKAELRDLEAVARLLGLGVDDVAASLDAAKAATSRPVASSFQLKPGDQICLTGQMSHPREAIEALLIERGLHIGGLSKQTRLLVAADPDSQSGKAGKARGYRVPIVAESALWASCSAWLTRIRSRLNARLRALQTAAFISQPLPEQPMSGRTSGVGLAATRGPVVRPR